LKLIERCATVKRGQVRELLLEEGIKTAVAAEERRDMLNQKPVPWGYAQPRRNECGFHDQILEKMLKGPPIFRLASSTFTLMAWVAERCITRMDEFQNGWSRIISKSL
jgi:hypothetical protein